MDWTGPSSSSKPKTRRELDRNKTNDLYENTKKCPLKNKNTHTHKSKFDYN